MKLTPIKANMNEVDLGDKKVLFSYQTPVAVLIKEGETWHQYKTSKSWSRTTTRHINQWNPLGGAFGIKPQEYFDALI